MQNQIPHQPKKSQQIFDLSKLSQSSIRKYQSYFQINCSQDQLKDRIKNHFNNQLKIQNNQVIQRFLELKRQDKAGDKKFVRARNPARIPNLN